MINPTGGIKPPARNRHGFAYDSTNNVFLLYGGQNGSGILGDTWVYDPVQNLWTQITPPNAPVVTNVAPFAKLSYDSDHNAFVLALAGSGGYFGGSWSAYSVSTYLFRYAGTGPNAGTLSSNPTPTPAAGSLNRDPLSWGKDPALTSSGTSLYVGWSELGSPFDPTDSSIAHIYVSQYSGGSWTPLGSSYTSVSTTSYKEAHLPSLTVIGGKPWASWYEGADSGQTPQVYAGSWDGISSWNGGAVGLDSTANPLYQGQSQIVGIAGAPYVAVLETDKSVYPQRARAYVRAWNGTAWSLIGGSLNTQPGAGTTALSVSIATDGTNPYVAWSEYLHIANTGNGYDNDTNPQIYVSQWNGSQWSRMGGALNINATNWAYDPSIATFGGKLYVAWTERSQTGNAQLYVSTWNGTSWVQLGSGAFNRAPGAGWAYHPSLIADAGTNFLYLAWVEQLSLGQTAQVFVSRYTGGVWTALGGALNIAPAGGSAQRVSVGVYQGQPVAAWGEVNAGAVRQVYVKQWNGSAWTLLPGPGGGLDTTAPSAPSGMSATAVSASQINLTWTPSTDIVGVTGYLVYRGGAPVATVTTGLAYSDTGLPPNTSYTYQLAATDAAGNISALSPSAHVTTLTSPVVPTAITLSPASVAGGTSTTANTVTLGAAAPSGNAVVTLSSNNPAAVVPPSVTVAAGTTTSTAFTITTSSVTAATPVTISATYNGVTVTSTLSVTPSVTSTGTVLLLHSDASEVSGTQKGSTVTPAIGPPGLTGTVIVNSGGSVNFTPAQTGNGVYFLNCCSNTSNAYYKFTGAALGSVFNVAQGQISFYLKSRYTFAQRKATASGQRYAFDVRDGNGSHLFSFMTEPSSGYLLFMYTAAGTSSYYIAPAGTEDALFGSGILLKVTLTWGSGTSSLYLNNSLVKSVPYTTPAPNWTAASNFDLGAYEYLTYGGYNSSDDVIDEFTVTGTPPASSLSVSLTAPLPGATETGTVPVTANATDTVPLTSVQFKLDGANLNPAVTGMGPTYSINWNTTATTNGPHTLTAFATDSAGNTATSTGVSITVSNAAPLPSVSAVNLVPTTVTGGVSTTANTVALSGPAPSGNAVVTLSSNSPNAVVPASVTVAAGSTTSPAFTITTSSVTSTTPVTISATYNGVTAPATLSVTPAATGGGPLLQLHLDASEVSGTQNGATVTPTVGPAGFRGTAVVNSGGSVNFTPAQTGNGVYFLNCCSNSSNAYYKFTGAALGSIFNVNQGQISFYLKSRYTFAQRKATASGQRYAFDVRDGNGTHLYSFMIAPSSGYLVFTYAAGGAGTYYVVPPGTEDALFGSGVLLNVTLTWGAGTSNLYLNGKLVQSVGYKTATANWTALSNFDLGAFEYLTYGGYNASDDVIDEFVVQ